MPQFAAATDGIRGRQEISMVAAYRFLRGDRNRHLLPHRQLAPLRELLLSMAEMARAAASQLDGDSRWSDAADALDAAAEALRKVAA